MGIKGLPGVIMDRAGVYAYQPQKNYEAFRGFKVAVDLSHQIFIDVIAVRSGGKDMKNGKGEITSHLYGTFRRMVDNYLKHGITPIPVIDGKPPEMKKNTNEKRNASRTLAAKKLENLTDEDDAEYIKNFKQTFKITKEHIDEIKILLDLMGIPYIEAPEEADVVCAWLCCRRGTDGERFVKGVCSNDSDMLALGAPFLFIDMFKNKTKPVKIINLGHALKKMKMTMEQFINMCVLLGTDYNENIKGIGPKTVYKLARKFSLEEIIKAIRKKRKITGEYTENEMNMFKARDYFLTAVNNLDKNPEFDLSDQDKMHRFEDKIKLCKFQEKELIDFLCVKHGFDSFNVKSMIDRLRKYQTEMNVTKENTKQVHQISASGAKLHNLTTDKIELLPSDSEDDTSDSDINEPTSSNDADGNNLDKTKTSDDASSATSPLPIRKNKKLTVGKKKKQENRTW